MLQLVQLMCQGLSPYQRAHLHNEAKYCSNEAMYLQRDLHSIQAGWCNDLLQTSSSLWDIVKHTLTAIHSVKNNAPMYIDVAMMRPFSNIFFNCASGPIKNIVLHISASISQCLKSVHHYHLAHHTLQ